MFRINSSVLCIVFVVSVSFASSSTISASSLFCSIDLIHGNRFQCFSEILAAAEIPADIICFSVHLFPLADRRGKEIAILFVILPAVKYFLHGCHDFNLLKVDFFCLWTETQKTETQDFAPYLSRPLLSVKGCRKQCILPLTGRAFPFTLSRQNKSHSRCLSPRRKIEKVQFVFPLPKKSLLRKSFSGAL